MKAIDVTVNEQIIKLMEEVLEKLSCLLSELYNANEDMVDSVIMTKDEKSISDETEITVNAEVIGDKEHIVLNSDEEEIKLSDEHTFVSCGFAL